MATASSANRSALVEWLIIAVGLGAAAGWLALAQVLGATIEVEALVPGIAIFYGLVFLPLLLLGIGLGVLSGVSALRRGTHPTRWLAAGIALGAGGLLLTFGYSWLNGAVVPGTAGSTGIALALAGCAVTALQVAAEEVLFRGWLQPALIRRTGLVAGILTGAVLFSTFHLLGGAALTALSLANLMLGGILFGLLAWRSGGILAPFAAHFGWNLTEDLGLGLVPNPGTGPLGALFDRDLAGSPLWGAGEEGLNASIGTAVVLLALIVMLLAPRRAAVAAPT